MAKAKRKTVTKSKTPKTRASRKPGTPPPIPQPWPGESLAYSGVDANGQLLCWAKTRFQDAADVVGRSRVVPVAIRRLPLRLP